MKAALKACSWRVRARHRRLRRRRQRGRFQRGDIGGELEVGQLRFGRCEALLQHLRTEGDEAAVAACTVRITACMAAREITSWMTAADDAQPDFRHTRDGQIEHMLGASMAGTIIRRYSRPAQL
jgi:hypothetical protein